MSSITSLGLGSGIDVAQLVEDLVTAEREPQEAIFDANQELYEAEISAFGAVKSAFNSFQTTVSQLNLSSSFTTKSAESGDDDLLSANATSVAEAGTYNIKVSSTAQSHSLATTTFSSVNSTVGTGTLTFKFGTTDYVSDPESYNSFTQNADTSTKTVTIDSSNSTLSGVRDAINDADIGVQATIVKVDSSNYKLVLTSEETGEDYSMEITVDDDDLSDTNTSGLSQLAFNSSATNLEQTQAGQDAVFSVNGLEISSSSNTVVGAIQGVTLNILDSDDTKTFKLTVSNDTESVKSNIQTFIEEYNSLIYTVSQYNQYDVAEDEAGVLFGDSTLRSLLNSVRTTLSSTVDGLTGSVLGLSSLGVTSRSYNGAQLTDAELEAGEIPDLAGMLVLNESTLDDLLETNFDDVAAVFAPMATTTDSDVTYVYSSDDTQPGNYLIEITQAATKGNYIAGGAADLTIVEGVDDEFVIEVDGVTSATITLTAGVYTAQELQAELQSRINGDTNLSREGVAVTVEENAGVFTIESTTYGSDSSVNMVSGNALSELGLDTGTSTDGVDVEGTIGGEVAIGSGQELTGQGSKTQGLILTIDGDSIGYRGSVKFTRGIADSLYNTINQFVKSDGLIESKVEGIESSIDLISEKRELLDARLEAMQERLLLKFNTMDSLVASYNSIGDYLTQQLDLLPGVTQWNNR